MLDTFKAVGTTTDGWSTRFLDPATGELWVRTFLGAEDHGGGLPVLVKEPAPTVEELLELVSSSRDPSEVAAGAWLLSDSDREGAYKDQLVRIAEEAARAGDQERVALLVGWGLLTDESNLRPTLGKSPDEVTADHQHFLAIAATARNLLRLKASDPLLRDPRVFEVENLNGAA